MLRSISECFFNSSMMHFRWWDSQNASELLHKFFSFALENQSRAEVFVSHQSWPPGSRQLSNKLKQGCKIRLVGLKSQKLATHSTGYMTQIPAKKRFSFKSSCDPFGFFLNFYVENNNPVFWFKSTNLTVLLVIFSSLWIILNKSWACSKKQTTKQTAIIFLYFLQFISIQMLSKFDYLLQKNTFPKIDDIFYSCLAWHIHTYTDNQICSKAITASFLQQRHVQFKNRNQMWQFYYLWFRLSNSLYNWLLIELFLWKVGEPHIFLYYVIYFSVVNYRKLILCCEAKMWSETHTWLWLKSL